MNLRIDVLSDEDFSDLIAELYVDGECLMIVSQENGFDSLDVEILPREDGSHWQIKCEQLVELLAKAKARLFELRKAPPQ